MEKLSARDEGSARKLVKVLECAEEDDNYFQSKPSLGPNSALI